MFKKEKKKTDLGTQILAATKNHFAFIRNNVGLKSLLKYIKFYSFLNSQMLI